MKKILLVLLLTVLFVGCGQKNNEEVIEEDLSAYDIFGGAEFDTVVKGYLKVLEVDYY